MSARKLFIATAGILGIFTGISSAQTSYLTVTNYVTVTITNVVVITNTVTTVPPAVVPTTPAAAPATPPAHSPPVVANNATNVPALSQPQIKYPWKNSVSAGLTLARGNTDTTLISADYSTTRKTPDNEYNGEASLAYGEQDSKQTADNYKGNFQWNHLFTDRFYAYGRTEALRDYIADIDYRFTLGPGLGYYVIKNKTTSLALGGGVNYEAQSQGGQANTFATLRVADRFEYKLSDSARIWQSFELLPEVDRFDNYLANFEVGAEAALYKSFTLKTVFSDNYDNRPAAAHEKNDVRLVAGVGYKF
jgi:putative salt-induced outer membrane protein YdiY